MSDEANGFDCDVCGEWHDLRPFKTMLTRLPANYAEDCPCPGPLKGTCPDCPYAAPRSGATEGSDSC